jgi:hypothetical protein
VKVPGNMSKQATIDAHIAEVKEARKGDTQMNPSAYADSVLPNDAKYVNRAHRPCVAVLTSVCVLDAHGDALYMQKAKKPERCRVALPLINFLKEQLPAQFANSLRYGDWEPDATILGFNVKEVLRIAAFEVLYRNARSPIAERVAVPVRLWHNPVGAYDPLDVMLPKADQTDLDLYSLMRYLNVDGADPAAILSDAVAQAQFALLLAQRAQLMPPQV